MKVCVYGCGAIGGLLAARLAASGVTTSVIARGGTLAAIRENGLQLQVGSDVIRANVKASENPADFGEQDFVFLCMKSHAVPSIARSIAPLLGPNTSVVTASNGIPWWYFYGADELYGTPEIASVDPGRALWDSIGPERAIGCVVYPAATVIAPGIVRHISGDRFAIGEPSGKPGERLQRLAGLLAKASFDAPIKENIRVDIWIKLVANAALNPVSVLSGETLGQMQSDPDTRELLVDLMEETLAVADELQVAVPLTPADLLEALRPFAAHKTSTLQDYEAGRKLELAPIVGAVLELASLTLISTPNLHNVYQRVLDELSA